MRQGTRGYKLSSNELAFPPLPGVLDAAAATLTELNRYPDAGCAALYRALADHLSVPSERLALGTGSVGVLHHLLQAYCGPGDEVVMAWRSFEAYPIATAAAGARSVQVPLTGTGHHDLPALLAAITERTRVVLVCSPNNPTGTVVGDGELAEFIAATPERVLVVLDEAYWEFDRSDSPVDGLALVRAHSNVVSLRTFSKAYGLAALRVGYAVAAPEVAAGVRAVALPFGVSTMAQAAAIASLSSPEELRRRVDLVVAERDRVLAGVRAVGWQVPDPQGNFLWFPCAGSGEVDRFVAVADELVLAVRPFAGEGVRVTVAEPEANSRVLDLARRTR